MPTRDGKGFQTVTTDHGAFKSLDGNNLTLTEGTKTRVYKVVSLTIPANATVRRNFASAKLADLRAGDEVNVATARDGTFVMARDASHERPPLGAFGARGGHRHHGLPGDGDGPPRCRSTADGRKAWPGAGGAPGHVRS